MTVSKTAARRYGFIRGVFHKYCKESMLINVHPEERCYDYGRLNVGVVNLNVIWLTCISSFEGTRDM